MKTVLRRSRSTENPAESRDPGAVWQSWIIESAGEPRQVPTMTMQTATAEMPFEGRAGVSLNDAGRQPRG
jgi:hypothetical protein